MKTILITGITGSLGRAITKILVSLDTYIVIGIYNSEQKYAHFKRTDKFNKIKCYKINISDSKFNEELDHIFRIHEIDYVIHSAAMKHVDICEENMKLAINTNVIASETLVNKCLEYKIKNLIALSTDKSLEPCNVYGYSKLLMQKCVLENNYAVYQGANFFWSDGSVLDIWKEQMLLNRHLTVTNLEHVRYFNTLEQVATILIKNLDTKGIILPDFVYIIKLGDLYNSFVKYYNYNKVVTTGCNSYEKNIEQLDDDIKIRIPIDENKIIDLIKEYLNNA